MEPATIPRGSGTIGFVSTAFVWVVAGFVTALIALHLAVGIWGYRRVMRREWPKVEPLADDDDW